MHQFGLQLRLPVHMSHARRPLSQQAAASTIAHAAVLRDALHRCVALRVVFRQRCALAHEGSTQQRRTSRTRAARPAIARCRPLCSRATLPPWAPARARACCQPTPAARLVRQTGSISAPQSAAADRTLNQANGEQHLSAALVHITLDAVGLALQLRERAVLVYAGGTSTQRAHLHSGRIVPHHERIGPKQHLGQTRRLI